MTEEQFLRFIARSVICILLCMICLVYTSWLWYELSILEMDQICVGAHEAATVHFEQIQTSP